MSLPQMFLVKQDIPAPALGDAPAAIRDSLASLNLASRIKPGMRVALTAGSRGVTDMAAALKETASFLRGFGAHPYVAPAMGSHGGATAQGQAELLAQLGITEQTVGAPIESHMETKKIGESRLGLPVFCGRDFTEADLVVVVNRIKPHTSFRGRVESGLFKMMAIGMGKRKGARSAHQLFLRHGFEKVVLEIGSMVLERLPILCGVALVENRLEQTAEAAAAAPDEFLKTEELLLLMAKSLMGRAPFEDVDLLIVDEMGKNISGAGMDSNVTGRIMNQATPEPKQQQFRRIYVRDLTPQSGGNALGVGAADYTHQRLVDKIDLEKTRINCVTATVPEKGRIPLAYTRDDEALRDALASAGVSDPSQARIVWIKNTLELDRMWISRPLLEEAWAQGGVKAAGSGTHLPFDQQGNLAFGTLG